MKEFLNGKTIQCTVVKSEQKQGPKAVFYVLSVEIADQLFPDESGKVVDCNSFRPCIEGKTYPFKFSITDKGGLMAERPKTTEDEKADQAKAQADAKAARLAKEAKEKADYEADQKARGMSDAPPQMAKDSTPSANLIPPNVGKPSPACKEIRVRRRRRADHGTKQHCSQRNPNHTG
jgi:hypothetical protein